MKKNIIEVFSECERKIQNGENVNCIRKLEGDLSIDYRALKPIIRKFYKANKFKGVCKMYVKQCGNPSQEYWDIVYDILNYSAQQN